ncbi:MAG: hypothetical protein EWV90_18385 [Microcystis aeruginosa Ma_QC_Ch_20071001_M135]|nr:MAG: hypothetical protein EWV90_18385 [Microcystis aeruginosa Ma_QC_Ch_20071001_M135]
MNSYRLFSYQLFLPIPYPPSPIPHPPSPNPYPPSPIPYPPSPIPHPLTPIPHPPSPFYLTNDCPTFNRFSGICPRFLCRFRGDQ